MTVLSLQWLAARPRRRTSLIRRPGAARHLPLPRHRERRTLRNWTPARRERGTYRDSFFADPAAVEDDSRRMMPPGCGR